MALTAGVAEAGAPTPSITFAPGLLPMSARPSMADLPEKDVKRQGGPWNGSPRECDPFNEAELGVLRQIKAWMSDTPGRFESIPADLLATFLRGYADLANWTDTVHAHLDATLKWREADQLEAILDEPVPSQAARELFDMAVPGGVIGATADGHTVVLETPGASSSLLNRLLDELDFDTFLRFQLFNKEVLRRYLASRAAEQGVRTYKVVNVVDLSGFGSAHLKSKLKDWFKRYAGCFGHHYPETMLRTYIIHAPMIFSALWAAVRIFLHPVTAAKISVSSRGHEKLFKRDGIELRGATVRDSCVSYLEVLTRLRASHDLGALARGYMPPEDAAAIDALTIEEGRARVDEGPQPDSAP